MAMVQLVVRGSLHVVRIHGGEVVGRDPRCDVVLDSPHVSRAHFSIVLKEDRYVVWDRASRNGTYVNQRRVSTKPLAHGDRIIVGDVVLTFWEEPRDLHNSLVSSVLLRFPECEAA